MGPRDSAEQDAEVAATWVVRIDRSLNAEEQQALKHWAESDSRHAGAFARAHALWLASDRAKIFPIVPIGEIKDSPFCKFRVPAPVAWAACVLLCASAAVIGWRNYSDTHLSTRLGEIRHIPLEDGSSLTMNTESRVKVLFSKHVRLIELDQGEALFTVAHDTERPFVVNAGNVHIRAVGTEFDVHRRNASNVEVMVTRGTVDVWRDLDIPEPSIRVSNGTRVQSIARHPIDSSAVGEADTARSIAWQDGILDLAGRTLGAAAAEFNRYNHEKLVIAPGLAQRQVVGRFSTSDPKGFAYAAAAMLDGKVRLDSDGIILERRTP